MLRAASAGREGLFQHRNIRKHLVTHFTYILFPVWYIVSPAAGQPHKEMIEFD